MTSYSAKTRNSITTQK